MTQCCQDTLILLVQSNYLLIFNTHIQFLLLHFTNFLGDVRQINRDVFTTSPFGDFDHHKSLKSSLKDQFDDIDATLKKFKNDLLSINLGNGKTMWDSVTVIVTSEFGRTLTPNSSGGTDHGWGGNTFIFGGEIAGGRVLGHHPDNYSLNDEHMTGRGAWIPTTSWEG